MFIDSFHPILAPAWIAFPSQFPGRNKEFQWNMGKNGYATFISQNIRETLLCTH